MVRKIIFHDEITLWWELPQPPYAKKYDVELNGKFYTATENTHLTFVNLVADTEYEITIKMDERVFYCERLKTKTAKNTIDISLPPYNACGDGVTLNTKALQRALDDCTENDCVRIPRGVFLSGALKMHSNTELYLEEGAVLQGTEDVEDYLPKIPSRFEGLDLTCYSSLLNMGACDGYASTNCKNVVIRGKGRIVGGGVPLRNKIVEVERQRLKTYIEELGDKIKEYETLDTIPGRARPRLINVSNTDGFIITGVSIENGPAWNLHLLYSKNISVYNCTFRSKPHINGDGCDPDSCKDVAIFNCDFYVGDDCIAIKSGRNPDGNKVNRPCQDIYIFDCRAHSGHGISIGSEMSGGVKQVHIWDCDMRNCVFGSQIKATKKRGGYVRNVHVTRCILPLVMIWSVPYNDDGESAGIIPALQDFYYKNCIITGKKVETPENSVCKHILLQGFDEKPIENVSFENIQLKDDKEKRLDILMKNVKNIIFN